ncbi:MAG TPA: methyltransferase domain-containing protein [Bryobacteraceae bacterium]|nr:methyltransferase domain-containing protein [Bryobacteraceae bacterium]
MDSSPARMERENEIRESFVTERLGHRAEDPESMDLTKFMHGGPGRLLRCSCCGLLSREEETRAHYEDDLYDPALMKHLYPRYVRGFESKREIYRPLLRHHAEVLEVGSHLGAFLQTAEEWGWRPTGLDIGAATSQFARQQGGRVKRVSLDDYSPRLRKPEAIFIWNCFEQLEDPGATLRRVRGMLDRHGFVVVRVPNADFYLRERELDRNRNTARRLLGYNNLLGFPYRFGYSRASLGRVLEQSGFTPVSVHDSGLLTPPYPDLSPRIRREWRDARECGAWIEMICR